MMEALGNRILKVGLAGAGAISYNHLVAWKQVPGVEVVAVADPVPGKAEARAGAFAIPNVHADVAAMVKAHPLDILDIASPRDRHAEHVRMAAARGIHVLCQKPLTNTLAEGEALAAEIGERVRFMVNDNRRFRSDFRQIARWIADGAVGEVRQVQMIMLRSGFLAGPDGRRPAVEKFPPMRTLKRLLIAETLIHQLDVLRFLVGDMTVVACRARRTEAELPGETMATLFLETAGGAPVILAGSFVAPGFGTAVSDRLELIGSRASVVLDNGTLSLLGEKPATLTYDMDREYQHCFDAGFRHFVECLRTGAPFESPVSDNLRTLRLVEEAYAKAALPC
jgi:predicted dehydrogenase